MAQECSLSDVPPGAMVRVLRVSALQCTLAERMRLLALGFTPGVEVRVCQGDGDGCRVLVRDSSIVLQDSVARSVLCEPLNAMGAAGTMATENAHG